MPRVPATFLVDCVTTDARSGRLTQRGELALPGGKERVRVRRLSAGTGLSQPVAARFLDACARAELLGSTHVDRIVGYDAGERPYVATASPNAMTLAAAAHGEAGGLDPAAAALIGEDVARGLAAAHELTPPLVHGALDMESILLTQEGHARITDYAFGALTLELREPRAEDARYFSPEKVNGGDATAASDLFSLGAILYETITGALAFAGDNLIATRILIQTGRVEPVSTLRPSTPAPLADLVHRLLSVSPGDRPSASQVAGTLAMLADRTGRARAELIRLATAPADTRSTTAHGPELSAYARSLVRQGAADRSTIPEPDPSPAPPWAAAPPPPQVTPARPSPAQPPAMAPAPAEPPPRAAPQPPAPAARPPAEPLPLEPTRIEPGLATPAPVASTAEPTELPVPRTVVMEAPSARTPASGSTALTDSGAHPLAANAGPHQSGAHPAMASGAHPAMASGAHGAAPTYTPGYAPAPAKPPVGPTAAAPTRRRSGMPAWLIWSLVAVGAFSFLGLVVGLAILLAS